MFYFVVVLFSNKMPLATSFVKLNLLVGERKKSQFCFVFCNALSSQLHRSESSRYSARKTTASFRSWLFYGGTARHDNTHDEKEHKSESCLAVYVSRFVISFVSQDDSSNKVFLAPSIVAYLLADCN